MTILFVNCNSFMMIKKIYKSLSSSSSSLMMVSKDTLDRMSNEISKTINTKYKAVWIGNAGGGNDWASTGIYYTTILISYSSSKLIARYY